MIKGRFLEHYVNSYLGDFLNIGNFVIVLLLLNLKMSFILSLSLVSIFVIWHFIRNSVKEKSYQLIKITFVVFYGITSNRL